MRRLYVLTLAAVLTACSGGGGSAVDEGVSDLGFEGTADAPPETLADAAPEIGPEAGPDAPPVDDIPILERPIRPALSCTKLHDTVKLADGSDPWMSMWSGAGVATVKGQAYLVRGENRQGQGTNAVMSTAAIGGTLGPPKTLLPSADPGLGVEAVAARDDKLGVLIHQSDAQGWSELAFLVATTDGTIAGGPTVLPGGQSNASRLIATPGGFAALHLSQYPNPVLTLHRFDAGGASAGPPTRVAQAPVVGTAAVVATSSGFAVAWTEAEKDDGITPPVVRFRLHDASGAPVGEARTLSPGSDGRVDSPALLARDGGYAVAWSERWWNGNMQDQQGWGVVRVALLDEAGAPVGPVHRVQAPQLHRDRGTPFLVDAGGLVGLGFRDETMIYVCAGCVSDAVIRFVPLHADDLTPAGETITMSSTFGGGLGGISIAPVGKDFLAYVRVEFHALASPALIAWKCE